MTHYIDELMMVAENRDPIPFKEAAEAGLDGKRLVFVSFCKEASDVRFDTMRRLVPDHLIEKVKKNRIYLLHDVEMLFLTEYEIEHGALRGLGNVVWCV